jgi:raffinose/stachyose/melibiose transport system permease protein
MHRYTWRTGALETVMIVLGLVAVSPLLVMVSLALRPQTDSVDPLSVPSHLTLENFRHAWTEAGLLSAIANSAVIAVVSVAVLVVLSSLAAYPLARVSKRWSALAYYGFILGLLIPFQLGSFPLYTTFRQLGLIGGVLPLIVLYVGIQMPFSIFLYSTFLRSVSTEYEEAAVLDGCSTLSAFRHVVFPLMRPVTGTVVIINLIFIWNDFFSPLLYLSGTSHQTIPVALYSFVGQISQQWNLVFAGLIIGIAPVVVAFFLMQKSVFQGFTGGLKG